MVKELEDVEVHDESFPTAGSHPIHEQIFAVRRAGYRRRIRQKTLGEKQRQYLVIPEFEVLPRYVIVLFKEFLNFI